MPKLNCYLVDDGEQHRIAAYSPEEAIEIGVRDYCIAADYPDFSETAPTAVLVPDDEELSVILVEGLDGYDIEEALAVGMRIEDDDSGYKLLIGTIAQYLKIASHGSMISTSVW